MLFAIDPGLRWCGLAQFDRRAELVRAELVRSPDTTDRGPGAWRAMAFAVLGAVKSDYTTIIIEVPRIYPHSGQQKGDLNDLLELAGVVGALSGVFDVVSHVYPAQWKGQVPKKVMNDRVLSKLAELERGRLVHTDHNTLDAVGIGLYALGRLDRKQVFR